MDKRFIVTQDKTVADKLMAAGFKLVSNLPGTWTFVNVAPTNFSFEAIDKKAIAFTNILNI